MPSSKARTVTLLGLGLMLSLFGDTAIYIVLPTHSADAGILLTQVGLMLSANRLIRIFINGPYGYLIERWPRRRVLVASQLIGAASNLLYVVTGFWPLLVGRLIWGIAWAGIWIGGNTAVLDVADSTDRGRLVGRFHAWGFVGFVGGALVGGLLTDTLGYQAAFFVCGCVSLAAALLWFFWLPETRPAQLSPAPAAYIAAALPDIPRPSRAPIITAALLMALNWLIFLGIIGALLPLLLQERVGSALMIGAVIIPIATLTGVIAALKDTVSLISAPVSGWLSDWLGDRWRLITAALLLGIAALLVIAWGTQLILVLGILLGAMTTSILQTQITAVVGDYAGFNRQGRILGLLNTVGDMGSAAGPLLAFALIDPANMSQSLTSVFLIAALLMMVALPWAAWVGWRARQIPVPLPQEIA